MSSSMLRYRVLVLVVAASLAAACGKTEPAGAERPAGKVAQAEKARPGTPEDDVVARATELLRRGEAEKARDLAREALNTHPDHIGLHRVYQDALRAMGGQEQALKKEYADLLAQHPNASLYQYLAGRSVFLENPVEAEQHFRKGIELDPGFLWNYLALGSLRSRNGDNFAAIQTYEKALKRFPNSANLYFNLAEAHFTIGSHRSALEAAKKAVEIDPNYALAYELMARVHLARGVNDEAMKAARQALAIDPKLGGANMVMAEALLKSGKNDEARAYAQKALSAGQDLPLDLKLKLQLEVPPQPK